MILTREIIGRIQKYCYDSGPGAAPGLWSADGTEFFASLSVGQDVAMPVAYLAYSRSITIPSEPHFMVKRQKDELHGGHGLREGQRIILDMAEPIISRFEKERAYAHFQICLQCGGGKTFLTRKLMDRLRLRTVIVLKCKTLFAQWENELQGMDTHPSLSGQKALLRSKQVHDVLICCTRHFESEPFVRYVVDNYSMIVIDESHMHGLLVRRQQDPGWRQHEPGCGQPGRHAAGNTVFSKFLALHPMPVCVSLTATPSRGNDFYLGTRLVHTEKNNYIYKMYIVKPGWSLCSDIRNVSEYVFKNANGRRLLRDQKVDTVQLVGFYKSLLAKADVAMYELYVEGILASLARKDQPESTKAIAISSSRVLIENVYALLKQRLVEGKTLFCDANESEIPTARRQPAASAKASPAASAKASSYAGALASGLPSGLASCKAKVDPGDSFVLLTTTQKGAQGLDVPFANTIHVMSVETNQKTLEQLKGRIERDNGARVRSVYLYDACGLSCDGSHPMAGVVDAVTQWRESRFVMMRQKLGTRWETHSVVVQKPTTC